MEIKNLGERFQKFRKEAGYTQKQVAEQLKIHQSNISDWENDISRPEYEKLVDLSYLYDVNLYDLLDVTEKPINDDRFQQENTYKK